jgi:WhiB family transcriptional regulator, redox-sensing transcriptional regulator
MTKALSSTHTHRADGSVGSTRTRRVSTARLPVYQGDESRAAAPWWEMGLCRGADPGLFFPPDDDARRERHDREEAAKELCLQCPVRRTCLDHALAVPEWFGVWGGTTELERKTLRQTRQVHGAEVGS